ncbi:MAG: arsenate reductase (azurin) small subunit [Hyphomicrobiaceae bacterium]|nr:MAG: arsenate reductase (azurin) small subunit [Hyphomicrobiaceae bacterium]
MTELSNHTADASAEAGERACLSRRQLLLTGGASVSVVALTGFADWALAQAKRGPQPAKPQFALKADYPRQRIGKLSALKTGQLVAFAYPYDKVRNILVKLGAPAGAGIGPAQDVVAFNQLCTHMGAPLNGTYKDKHQVLGPCPLHLTTFDLTRHGMVVSGHATESLPQIVLETQGDEIYAVGVLGLIYGYSKNIANPRS